MCKLPVHFVALAVFLAVVSACGKQGATTKSAQQDPAQLGVTLPLPATPTASIAKRRLQDSEHHTRVDPARLAKDAPNVLIIMIDDCGFGTPSTFGGFAQTPNLSKLSTQGISYNRFHTTSICSPTRACLLTGRNHQRVGSGTIAERAALLLGSP